MKCAGMLPPIISQSYIWSWCTNPEDMFCEIHKICTIFRHGKRSDTSVSICLWYCDFMILVYKHHTKSSLEDPDTPALWFLFVPNTYWISNKIHLLGLYRKNTSRQLRIQYYSSETYLTRAKVIYMILPNVKCQKMSIQRKTLPRLR